MEKLTDTFDEMIDLTIDAIDENAPYVTIDENGDPILSGLASPSLRLPFLEEYCGLECFEEAKRIHDVDPYNGYTQYYSKFQDPYAAGFLDVNCFRIDEVNTFYWAEILCFSFDVVDGVTGPYGIEQRIFIYAVLDNDNGLVVPYRTEKHETFIEYPSAPDDDVFVDERYFDPIGLDDTIIDEEQLTDNAANGSKVKVSSQDESNYVFTFDCSGNPVINMKKLEKIGFVPKEKRKKLIWIYRRVRPSSPQ